MGCAPEPKEASWKKSVGTRPPKLSLHVPGLVWLKRKWPVVGRSPGLAEPLSVAELDVIEVAAFVVTVGGSRAFGSENCVAKTFGCIVSMPKNSLTESINDKSAAFVPSEPIAKLIAVTVTRTAVITMIRDDDLCSIDRSPSVFFKYTIHARQKNLGWVRRRAHRRSVWKRKFATSVLPKSLFCKENVT